VSPLSRKHEEFVRQYLVDLDATKAYLRAGYKSKAADVNGPRLLKHPAVKAAIDAALAERARRGVLQLDKLERELALICHLDPASAYDEHGNLLSIPKMPEATRRALAGMDVEHRMDGHGEDAVPVEIRKIKFIGKREAIELALRRLGALNDKLGVEATVNIKIDLGDG
jgi:phage terminase small subunit